MSIKIVILQKMNGKNTQTDIIEVLKDIINVVIEAKLRLCQL